MLSIFSSHYNTKLDIKSNQGNEEPQELEEQREAYPDWGLEERKVMGEDCEDPKWDQIILR